MKQGAGRIHPDRLARSADSAKQQGDKSLKNCGDRRWRGRDII
jgi:hypothetical protein